MKDRCTFGEVAMRDLDWRETAENRT
jgi:hypothetical protein